eukprot:903689-Rhodomonas_salina.1
MHSCPSLPARRPCPVGADGGTNHVGIPLPCRGVAGILPSSSDGGRVCAPVRHHRPDPGGRVQIAGMGTSPPGCSPARG